jgi:hypothetical protein
MSQALPLAMLAPVQQLQTSTCVTRLGDAHTAKRVTNQYVSASYEVCNVIRRPCTATTTTIANSSSSSSGASTRSGCSAEDLLQCSLQFLHVHIIAVSSSEVHRQVYSTCCSPVCVQSTACSSVQH